MSTGGGSSKQLCLNARRRSRMAAVCRLPTWAVQQCYFLHYYKECLLKILHKPLNCLGITHVLHFANHKQYYWPPGRRIFLRLPDVCDDDRGLCEDDEAEDDFATTGDLARAEDFTIDLALAKML